MSTLNKRVGLFIKSLFMCYLVTIFSAKAIAEEVTVTLSYPNTTYGIGVLQQMKTNMSICNIVIDDVIVGTSLDTLSISLDPGTYDFVVNCFGPADSDGNRQNYFSSETTTQTVYAGVTNTVDVSLLNRNPKKVTVTIDDSNVGSGNWIVEYLNGETEVITLDSSLTYTDWFYDENPPYLLLTESGGEMGKFNFEDYTFTLMPTKTSGITISEVETVVNVELEDPGYIYNPDVGLEINNRLDDNSVVEFTVQGIPDGSYEFRVTDSNGVYQYSISADIMDSNGSGTIACSDIGPLSGDTTFTIDFSSVDLSVNYKVFLILQEGDLI